MYKKIGQFVVGILAVGFIGFIILTVVDNLTTKRGMVAAIGECLTTAPKDRTAITLRVRTIDISAATSMKIASSKMSEITTYLKTLDVEMQTTGFDSYEKTEWDQQTQRSITLGIETNMTIQVSAKDVATIETILEKFAGNTDVYTENLHAFTSAKTMQPIMEKCLTSAVENARVRAESIAAADGKKIGRLVSASYGNADSAPIMPTNFLRTAKLESAVAYDTGGIVNKDTDVSVNVSAVFEMK